MGEPGWSRRGVLGLLLLAGGAAAGGLAWSRTGLFERPPDARRFRELLLDSSHTGDLNADFGRLYLLSRGGARVGLDTLADELMERLEADRPWRRLYGRLGASELERRLTEAIAADFLADDGICQIEGWYLARTECRLAAMKFLALSSI